MKLAHCFTALVALVLILGACTYSEPNRAAELASATATPTRTPVPAATPASVPSVEPVYDEESPEPARPPGFVVIENVEERLNIRSGPGTTFGVVDQADLGATLASTGNEQRVDEAVWVEVVLDSGTGWVHGGFVGPGVAPTPTPLVTPTPLATPTPSATGDNLIVDAPLGLNLRTGPGTDATVIRQLDDGSIVKPTGATETDEEDRNWVEVMDGDDTGWLAEGFLRAP